MADRIVLNGISFHGKGAINEIPGIVGPKGFRKAFIASDPDLIKFGVIIVSSLPVIIVFPFLQKYFEKGVMIGSVKG